MHEPIGIYNFHGGLVMLGKDSDTYKPYPYKVLVVIRGPSKRLMGDPITGTGWYGELGPSDLAAMGGPAEKVGFTFADKQFINLGLSEDGFYRIRLLTKLHSPRHDDPLVFTEGEESE